MGLTLKSKHSLDYDMGYITFYRLRSDIKDYVYNTAQKDIYKDIPQQGTVSFFNQSDCEGKLTPKECKDLLLDIQNMKDNGEHYGYIGRGVENCLTITKFKKMLENCISHHCNLKWF